MLTLGLDTSEKTGSLAIVRGTKTLSEQVLGAGRRHETGLGDAMRRALAEARVQVRDLEAVVVGLGPGSFTGVRIGVTFAKTLAYARKLPLRGVSGLLAMAVQACPDGTVAVLRQAQPRHVYGGLFETGRSPPKVLRPVDLWEPRRLLADVPQATRVMCAAGGDEDLEALLREEGLVRTATVDHPSAAILARIGAQQFGAGHAADDPLVLAPMYCQASAPER